MWTVFETPSTRTVSHLPSPQGSGAWPPGRDCGPELRRHGLECELKTCQVRVPGPTLVHWPAGLFGAVVISCTEVLLPLAATADGSARHLTGHAARHACSRTPRWSRPEKASPRSRAPCRAGRRRVRTTTRRAALSRAAQEAWRRGRVHYVERRRPGRVVEQQTVASVDDDRRVVAREEAHVAGLRAAAVRYTATRP